MLECVSVANMRLSDRNTIEKSVSGIELISRAATAVFNAVDWYGKIAILVGGGNNGADGYALARILKQQCFDVTVYFVSKNLHSDCLYYCELAISEGVLILDYVPGDIEKGHYDIVVDCMLGTGFNGELRPRYVQAIQDINRAKAYVVSVDINSGMDGDTGEGEYIVCSDLTVAIEFIKKGQITKRAEQFIKRLIYVPIGIELAYEEYKICTSEEWESFRVSDNTYICDNGITYFKCPRWLETV